MIQGIEAVFPPTRRKFNRRRACHHFESSSAQIVHRSICLHVSLVSETLSILGLHYLVFLRPADLGAS